MARKRTPDAIADNGSASRLDPDNVDIYLGRGQLYLDSGEYLKALVDFDRVLRLWPDHASGYYWQTGLFAARRLMDTAEYEAAIDVPDELYKAEPNHDSLRRLRAEAEAAFVERAYRHYLPDDKFPVLARSPEELTREQITPSEFFLLSRMDGTWSVRSIVQVSPIRGVEALRAMKRMRESGLISLRDPA